MIKCGRLLILALTLGAGFGCQRQHLVSPAILHCAVSNRYAPLSSSPFGAFRMNDLPLHSALYTPLFSLDDKLQPHPFLIDKYEKQGDKVLFYLKKNLRFSNGRKIVAGDVVRSIIQSIQNVEIPNPIYKYMPGGDDIFNRRQPAVPPIGVIAPDRFYIRFRHDNDLFPHYLAWKNAAIVPRDWSARKPVYSGPYVLRRIEEREKCTLLWLQANPHYPGPAPKMARVCLHYFKTDKAFSEAVQSGATDVFFSFLNQMQQIAPDYLILRSPIIGGLYIRLNPNHEPLRSREFRRQLLQQVDFSTLISQQHWRNFSPATHILPYGLEEYFIFKPLPAAVLRPAAADRQAARPGQTVRLDTSNMHSPVRDVFIKFWQQELQKCGIELQPQWLDSQEYWKRFRSGEFTSTVFYYMLDIPLAIYFYESLFTPGLELNPQHPVARAMQLLEEYERIQPTIRRLTILSDLEEIARDEAIVIPVYNLVATVGYKKWAKGVGIDHLLRLPFEEIAIEKGN